LIWTKKELRLPVQVGFPLELEGIIDEIEDPSFSTAIGLVLWSIDNQVGLNKQGNPWSGGVRQPIDKVRHWFRGFLP